MRKVKPKQKTSVANKKNKVKKNIEKLLKNYLKYYSSNKSSYVMTSHSSKTQELRVGKYLQKKDSKTFPKNTLIRKER